MAAFKIPLNPPWAKRDFQKNFAKFLPLAKGARGFKVLGKGAIWEKTFAIPHIFEP
jgi:hypothetical protein